MNKLLIIISLTFLFGCAPKVYNSVTSNKVEGYDFKSDKIFVLIYEDEKSSKIIREIGNSVVKSLDSVEVENTLLVKEVDGLSFESQFPAKEVQEYKPDTILILGLNEGSFTGTTVHAYKMFATLVDPIEGRVVWKAELSRGYSKDGSVVGFNQHMENKLGNLSANLVKQMNKDELLDANFQNLIYY